LYCPRFTYFEYVLNIPEHQEKEYKVQKGREVHEAKAEQNREYLRRRLGVVAKEVEVYLTNDLLRGEVDEVLTLQDGTMAPLDYKFAKWEERLYDTYKTQLACYAWLITHNFGKEVTRGYLVYTRSKNHLVEVPIDASSIEEVRTAAKAIQSIIQNNVFPPATKVRKRCDHCTYRNVCPQ
jgi:CRISPR-associated exonuclease Cas4